MTKGSMLLGATCLIVGAIGGIAVGAAITRRQYEQEIEEQRDFDKKVEEAQEKHEKERVDKIVKENPIKPDTTTVAKTVKHVKTAEEYKDYTKMVNEYAPNEDNSDIEDVTGDVEAWDEEHGGEVKIVPENLYDPYWYPEGPRDIIQLNYFVFDHILCSEDGTVVLDTDPIYDAFFNSEWADSDSWEDVYICDNIHKVDYTVNRNVESYDQWFPSDED